MRLLLHDSAVFFGDDLRIPSRNVTRSRVYRAHIATSGLPTILTLGDLGADHSCCVERVVLDFSYVASPPLIVDALEERPLVGSPDVGCLVKIKCPFMKQDAIVENDEGMIIVPALPLGIAPAAFFATSVFTNHLSDAFPYGGDNDVLFELDYSSFVGVLRPGHLTVRTTATFHDSPYSPFTFNVDCDHHGPLWRTNAAYKTSCNQHHVARFISATVAKNPRPIHDAMLEEERRLSQLLADHDTSDYDVPYLNGEY
jgi:hypothetical protein